MTTLKTYIEKFRALVANEPTYYEDEDGSRWGDYDAWLIELGHYYQVISEARARGRDEDDSIDDLIAAHTPPGS